MTQYYIDADNGSDAADGLTAGSTDWLTLDKFTENARSAGDIATLRRGTTGQYDNGSSLDFTSDGTFGNPIIVEADYDDNWSDDVTSTQTYTLVFGSKTHTASATITTLAAGEWVYNTTDGDDPREFAYEVASVSGTTLTLKLPFKGSTGATKSLTVMLANPVWGNTSAHAFRMLAFLDEYWKLQGVDFESTLTANSTISLNAGSFHLFKDCHIHSAGTTSKCIILSANIAGFLRKVRLTTIAANCLEMQGGSQFYLEDVLTEGSTANSIGRTADSTLIRAKDCEFADQPVKVWSAGDHLNFNSFLNCIFPATAFAGTGSKPMNFINSQDHDGVVGASYLFKASQQTSTDPLVVEETTTVRSGGSNTSLKVVPSSASLFGTVWEFDREILLEIPIFATTDSKKYEIFFRPTLTSDWTTDPLATELWIELEAWGHASNNHRKITKSTGVIDMNGSITWTALDVTVAPAQAGVAFLRVYYAKPKEDTDTFFIDPVPVIT